jgi:hypothetical protein
MTDRCAHCGAKDAPCNVTHKGRLVLLCLVCWKLLRQPQTAAR